MSALRERAGWDLKALGNLPFMTFARKLEIEFLHPVVGDQEITIASFVREFSGPDAHVECSMTDERGSILSQWRMVVAYVDKGTMRSADWPDHLKDLFLENQAAD